MENENGAFSARLGEQMEEMRELYMGLYGDEEAFAYFLGMLERCYEERKAALRAQDERRLSAPGWQRSNELLGMTLYPADFAGTLRGVQAKLPYLEECGVNYLHLMPILDTPPGRSDGGYAVSDFRKVRPDLGTMDDLEALGDACREKGIRLCLDFVMNHTSEDHIWARRARAGDPEARARYFFYDDWTIPSAFEKTVPQVFPTTAPGSFTWLSDCNQVVMTSFYPYQWDLNYANPVVFNDMTENLLFLANRGVDVVRLDAVPYIWKELGTSCRNLPQVHSLVRLMHLACRAVCPGVLLLGEVVMEPVKVAPYFGSAERPECHMLYNVTTMCTTWHTLATRDTRLLRRQIELTASLGGGALFQNYLRCHDDIGWGLDYAFLEQFGIEEVAHKRYLNDWFTGRFPGSWSRGELYNDDPRLGDARFCGTTASMAGLETAAYEPDPERRLALTERALACDLMLHAFMLTQSGIPMLYSGDEVARLNDYAYHDDPERADDSRYIHRGRFNWQLAELRSVPGTPQNRMFAGLRALERIRAREAVFHADADVSVLRTESDAVLGVRRSYRGEHMTALFNFSEHAQRAPLPNPGVDLRSGLPVRAGEYELAPYGFLWLRES